MMDTARTIEIEGLPAKPLVLFVIVAVMALFSFMLAYPLSDSGVDRILKPIFYGLAVIFGVCAVQALRSLFGLRGLVVRSARQRADLTTLPISQDRAIAGNQRRAEIARSRQQDTIGGIARRRAGQE
jgi:hypothetical protein